PPAVGWKVYLDVNGNGLLDAGDLTAVTDGAGNYRFEGVPAGPHTVLVALMPGDVVTWPSDKPRFTLVTDGQQATALPLGVRRQLTVIPVTAVDTLFHPGSGDAAVNVVRSLYRAILGREADEGGLAFHAAQLRQFGAGRVVDALWNSAEHRT